MTKRTTKRPANVECGVYCWRLAELMAKGRVKGTEISELLNVGSGTITGWRNATELPGIGGDRLATIVWALNTLAKPGTLDEPVTLTSLVYLRDR